MRSLSILIKLILMFMVTVSCSPRYSAEDICFNKEVLENVKLQVIDLLGTEIYRSIVFLILINSEKSKEVKFDELAKDLTSYWIANTTLKDKYNAVKLSESSFECSVSLYFPIPIKIFRDYLGKEEFSEFLEEKELPTKILVKYSVEYYRSRSGEKDLFKVEIIDVTEIEN